MKVLHPPVLLAALVLVFYVPSGIANQPEPGNGNDTKMAQMLKQLEMLDQLDQLDREDFRTAIHEAGECTDNRNFDCADRHIREAERLAFDEATKNQVADARSYRAKMYQIVQEEKQQLAMERRIKACNASCPVSAEYNDCVAGYLNPRYCREPSYNAPPDSDNTLLILNQTVQQFKQFTENELARQRQQLATQQQIYEHQKRQREQQQRDAERRQARQLAQAERRETELTERRAQLQKEQRELRARRQAEADAQRKAEEHRQARETRQQEILERQRAREQEIADREARRANYLARLKTGIELRGKGCMDSKVVYGTIPDIKPKQVGCQDVYYNLYCPGSTNPQYQGVMKNMLSNPRGACFAGDIDVLPKGIPCKAREFRVKVTRVTSC